MFPCKLDDIQQWSETLQGDKLYSRYVGPVRSGACGVDNSLAVLDRVHGWVWINASCQRQIRIDPYAWYSILCIVCTTYVSLCSYSYSTYKDIPGIRSNDSHWPLSALALACMHITISDSRQPRREGTVHKSISFLALSRHILGTNFSASNGEIEMQIIPWWLSRHESKFLKWTDIHMTKHGKHGRLGRYCWIEIECWLDCSQSIQIPRPGDCDYIRAMGGMHG